MSGSWSAHTNAEHQEAVSLQALRSGLIRR